MKKIRIAIVNDWLTESAQGELEKALAKLDAITDFVFNEKGDLEVTYDNTNWQNNQEYIANVCNIQIQYAMYVSGKEKASQQPAHLFI